MVFSLILVILFILEFKYYCKKQHLLLISLNEQWVPWMSRGFLAMPRLSPAPMADNPATQL